MFTLRLLFAGLVAFTPSTDDTRMSVLLVDGTGRQYASDGCPLLEHQAFLIAPSSATVRDVCSAPAECPESPLVAISDTVVAGQRLQAGLKAWRLRGALLEVRVEGLPSAPLRLQLTRPEFPGVVPANQIDASASSWVPNSAVGDEVDPDCLGKEVKHCPLAARVNIGGGRLETCRLLELSNSLLPQLPLVCSNQTAPQEIGEEETGVYAFQLRPLGQYGQTPDPLQAMADRSRLVIEGVSEGGRVVILVKNLDGALLHEISVPGPAGDYLDLWIVNLAHHAHINESDVCYQEGRVIDKHFELYYHLSRRAPSGKPWPLASRPVPQATNCRGFYRPSQACELPFVGVDDTGFLPGDKGACANKTFTPSSGAGILF